MMRKVKRHNLNYKTTLEYFKYNLEGLNILSIELLNLINFDQGSFFTLLLEHSNYDRLYEFEAGLVLPQNPEIEYFVSGRRCTYSHIPTMQDEIADFIVQQLRCNKKLSCVFDDFLRAKDSPFLEKFRENKLLHSYGEEVFYLIKNEMVSLGNIEICLEKSNVIWHSLCILSIFDLQKVKNLELTFENIQEICIGAEIILLGAYDGEGYVLWEKSNKYTALSM